LKEKEEIMNGLNFNTGGESVMAEKFSKAIAKKEQKNQTAIEPLPDLEKIDVSEINLPVIDKAKIRTEADGARQWAESAGSKLAQLEENLEKIQAKIKEIEGDPNSKFSSSALNTLAQLRVTEAKEKAKIAQLKGISNEDLKKHMEFSAFLEEIRGTDPSHYGEVREIWNQVHKKELRKIISKEQFNEYKLPEKMGLIFFEGKISVPISGSDGQKALEAELRKIVDEAKLSKAASIKNRGNADLSGFEKSKPGLYYFYSPKRIEEAHFLKDGVTQIPERKFYEGHALIEIRDLNKGKFYFKDGKKVFKFPRLIVEVRDAVGSLLKLANGDRKSLPFSWIAERRISSKDPLEQEDFDRALWMIKVIWAVFGTWKKGLNPKATKSSTQTIDEPAFTIPADNSAVVVEKFVNP
jgi:hypothetical protein